MKEREGTEGGGRKEEGRRENKNDNKTLNILTKEAKVKDFNLGKA